MSILGRATSCQVLPEYSIPLKPDNYLMITREPPAMSISLSLRYFGKSSKSTVSWCSKKAFRFTIGSCCCLPCCENASSDGRELTDYVTEDREPLLNKGSDCTKKTLTERADCNMKQRLRRHYQDHVQKWSREKSPRFPWKAALHLLLVAFVTTQVSCSMRRNGNFCRCCVSYFYVFT